MTDEATPHPDESLLNEYVELLSSDPSAAEKLAAARPDLEDLFICLRTLDLLSEQLSEDRTIAEIAEITGRKEGTLRCHLHRGLAQLQDILSRYGVLPR